MAPDTLFSSIFRWANAKETLQELSHVLDGREFGPAGFVQFFSEVTNGSLEVLEWLLGNEPKEKTANREYVALLNAALQDAHTSNSKLLSSKTLELSKRINPDFEGESFDDLFRHVSNLSDVLPHFALARKKHEASVYGLLARNCSQSDEPNIRRLSDEFLQRALWLSLIHI